MPDSPQNGSGTLDKDLSCMGCGYNLRGLSPEGLCPECGRPISDALRGDRLEFADADWLERLRFGASLKLWNIALMIIVGLLAGGLVGIFGFPMYLLSFLGIVGGALGLWASFAITTQEPRISLQEDAVTLRKIVRTFAVIGFAGELLEVGRTSGDIGTVLAFIGQLLGLAGAVTLFGELLYFRRFALRIPDLKLAKSTKILMWTIPVITVLAVVGGLIAASVATAVPAPAAAPGTIVAGGMCVVAIVVLILFLWYVRLLTRYKNAFKTAAEKARSLETGLGDLSSRSGEGGPASPI